MMGIFAIIFWICIGGILHTYLLYPLLLRWWAAGKEGPKPAQTLPEPLPFMSVLLSAYNEEAVLEAKLQNLLELDYPPGRIRFFVGSDGSSDKTNELLKAFGDRSAYEVFLFEERRGKPSVLNDLAHEAQKAYPGSDHIFLLTDASVLIDPRTPKLLVRHFQDQTIGLVDTRMVHTGLEASGISKSEDLYISREVQIKDQESRLWGTMIGPFGGCFALRAELYEPLPPNYLVDD
ncbi:MAG: glycosyltransferase, partial [Phaeodactylibacter sp.]|nr:glycosyltransferase [Phaeodactylibacter sp.]